MQAVRSYQDALPFVFFLGQLRLFSSLRRVNPIRFSPLAGHAKPVKWWDSSTGHSGYQHGFQTGSWRCEVALTGELASALPSLAAEVEREVCRIEGKYSRYGETSVIQALNQNAGRQAVAVDAETDCLLDLVHEQWQRSEGLVDATSGVVRYAWDEGQFEAPHDSRELQHLMTCIGWNHVRRMPGWVRFEHPALELDLGSLHEAFAVDRAVAKVQAVEGVGVSLRVGHARRVAGTLRSSAARRPAAPLQTGSLDALLASWPLRTGGLVARGFAFDAGTEDSVGQLGFDPTTGRPLQTWHQMAVLAATAVEADTLVKTSLVKGANAVEWLNQQQACYYALRRDDKLFCSGLDAAMLAATPTGIAA